MILYVKTNLHLWSYLAHFFTEWEMLRTKDVKKSKHIACSVTSFLENRTSHDIIWKNVVQSGRPQVKQWLFRIAWYTPKATNLHSEYAIFLLFHCNNAYTNTPQCYVIRTLPILFVPCLPASYPCRVSRNPGLITAVIERIYYYGVGTPL